MTTGDRGAATGTRPLEDAWAVIMAGGSGTRFWPLSRERLPKQFLAIVGERSLLQQTWDRCVGVVGDPSRVLVVTSVDYADLTREQLPDLAPENLLAEPQARNTAPCLAWAAAVLAARDPEALMLVFPADHVIRDVAGLQLSARAAAAAARRGHLVTFGVPPRYPETGYGYVELGDDMPLPEDGVEVPAYDVAGFREKPDAETARRYVAAGSFMWNSGMFVWRATRLLEAMQEHLPDARRAALEMLEIDDDEERRRVYATMPATSIDYGIMERADDVACVRATFDWSDVGSWEALSELVDADESGNVTWGRIATLDSRGNLVYAPGETVALLGVDDLAIVRAGDVLMVAALHRSQEVKALRERLAELGLEDVL